MKSSNRNEKKIVIFDIDYTLFDTDIFKSSGLVKHQVYDEVKDVLQKVSEFAKLGILSEGHIELQNKKLSETEIAHFFVKDNIHIVENKSENLNKFLNSYEGYEMTVVDDKLTILSEIKAINPRVTVIWVKRGRYAINQKEIKGFTPDAIVSNLSEIIPILNS